MINNLIEEMQESVGFDKYKIFWHHLHCLYKNDNLSPKVKKCIEEEIIRSHNQDLKPLAKIDPFICASCNHFKWVNSSQAKDYCSLFDSFSYSKNHSFIIEENHFKKHCPYQLEHIISKEKS